MSDKKAPGLISTVEEDPCPALDLGLQRIQIKDDVRALAIKYSEGLRNNPVPAKAIAIGGAVPPPASAPTFTPQPPPQANQSVPTPQPYGVVPGIPTASPYVLPGQTQIYPQGPPPTYDQALTHPAAIVGQPMYHPGTMYAAGYPTYLGYPTYAPMQYYPSLGAYSYAMQPAQLRPTIMIPNGYDAGARFDGLAQPVLPPAPPGVPPSAAQLAAMAGHQVALGQKKNSFLAGGSDGGYTFW